MTELQSLYKKYKNIAWDELNTKMDDELKEVLVRIPKSDIKSIKDAQAFLEILWKYRKHLENNMKYYGDNFKDMLQSVLGVGANGLYQFKIRFLFELIQNVDDCEYEDPNNCNLDIFFDFNRDEIVLTYNETGFTPFNVYAITGIAEAAKNISTDKIEIGEKGIGFKSVFGIARKVLIQSGYFSFELDKDNFTLPKFAYENYKHVSGTKMTIYLSKGDVNAIYNSMSNSYVDETAIFDKNPVLFLNKLTHLRMYNDNSWRNMVFDISRDPIDYTGGLHIEHGVKVSVNLGNADTGKKVKKEIVCNRYTLPVLYNEAICKSRYGENTKLTGKKMHVQVLVPVGEHIKQLKSGSLYSFLPTQIKLKIPAVLHAPFKLDASREFVDDQNNNEWFKHTCSSIGKLLDGMYKDLAKDVKEDIVYYLPPRTSSIIDTILEKTKLLGSMKELSGGEYFKLPLFHTVSDKYFTFNKIVSFPADLDSSICPLLCEDKNWFVPPHSFTNERLRSIGIPVENNIANEVFNSAISNESNSKQCFEYLCSQKLLDKISFDLIKHTKLTIKQISCLFDNPEILDKINSISGNRIRGSKDIRFIVTGIKSTNIEKVLQDRLTGLPVSVQNYLKSISNNCALLEGIGDRFFIGSNTVILGKGNEIDSFINLCDCIAPKSLYVSMLKTSKFSSELDKLDRANITNADYMQQLRLARENLKNTLGTNQYNSYIDILLKCGTDSNRFLNELLQNADDCIYATGAVPTFSLKMKANKIITTSNELGFERANVRAITAIGDSTKELLFTSKNKQQTIGYKGVGFKMVFAVANSVNIHSNRFHFRLTADNPIVPKLLKDTNNTFGTEMIFELRDSFNLDSMTTDKVLRLCLCLRKLKKLSILNYDIEICDEESARRIKINNKEYLFKKKEHIFEIDDLLIKEELSQCRKVEKEQSICCYAAYDKDTKKILEKGRLYCGLPTEIQLNVPLSIDGPFKLTTSRDDILQCNWNTAVTNAVYDAICSMLDSLKIELRTGVLEYIKFRELNKGSRREYLLEMFDGSKQTEKLNSIEFLTKLKGVDLLPTKDTKVFVSANKKSKKYPHVVEILLQSGIKYDSKCNILDVGQDLYTVTLNGLGVETASFDEVYAIIEKYIDSNISDKKFRESFYTWLRNSKLIEAQKTTLAKHKVVPVYENSRTRNKTVYVPAEKGKICICEETIELPSSYKVLNELLLAKKECVAFFGVSPTEADKDIIPSLYLADFRKGIDARRKSKYELYQYILEQYKSGKVTEYDALGFVWKAWNSGDFCFKNVKNRITPNAKYISHQIKDFFASDLINELIIHDECISLAKDIGVKELSKLTYQDIPKELKVPLNDNDIEGFLDNGFIYEKNIIEGFVADNLVTERQIDKYGLVPKGANIDLQDEIIESYEFPSEYVGNTARVAKHARDEFNRAGKIVNIEEIRLIQKVLYPNGDLGELGTREARQTTMARYNPDGTKDVCYCQMCEQVKLYRNIEVNSILKTPDKFLPPLRVALCLECSKLFELYRRDSVFYEVFLENLKSSNISGGAVKVPIGDKGKTIKFTAIHLLEVQELLKLI